MNTHNTETRPIAQIFMTGNHYQEKALKTAIYPDKGDLGGLLYVSLGLGEAGEIQGKVKKILRDHNGDIQPHHKYELVKELGDLLWYIAAMAKELDYGLEEIMVLNLEKLASREKRGTLKGNGDNR